MECRLQCSQWRYGHEAGDLRANCRTGNARDLGRLTFNSPFSQAFRPSLRVINRRERRGTTDLVSEQKQKEPVLYLGALGGLGG